MYLKSPTRICNHWWSSSSISFISLSKTRNPSLPAKFIIPKVKRLGSLSSWNYALPFKMHKDNFIQTIFHPRTKRNQPRKFEPWVNGHHTKPTRATILHSLLLSYSQTIAIPNRAILSLQIHVKLWFGWKYAEPLFLIAACTSSNWNNHIRLPFVTSDKLLVTIEVSWTNFLSLRHTIPHSDKRFIPH